MFRVSNLLLVLGLLCAPLAHAIGPTTTVEGISNDVDLKERDPVMVFGKAVFTDSSRILVDAMIRNNLYAAYPIRFDFYINGNLLLSQFRSKEFPIPIGITLSKKEFPLPYNFTVVATLTTPNRTFTTTAYGVMNTSDFAVTLPCTLTVTAADGSTTTEYTNDSVALGTAASGALAFSFTGTSDTQSTQDVAVSLNVSGTKASGTLTLSSGDSNSTTVNVNGTVEITDGNLTSLNVEFGDSTTTLSCG